ncbi:helix-turn-helix domain-containing protein [Streptomyces ovatisporus]|uniref:Helix-turn-helix domain-containing protein n=1 Tax=Streptomyces ovatisporus TaxID=1128682 RepID=A0ABV9AGF7_9ACTN
MAVPADRHRIACDLDRLLAERGMTLTELADRVGVTVVNLSVLKNDRAKAVRFSTLTAICDVLECTPGEILTVLPPPEDGTV